VKLNQLTIPEAINGLKQKKFSSQEILKDCLERIRKVDSNIKSFITVSSDYAKKEAIKADEVIKKEKDIFSKKSLWGIPFAIKDNFCTKGIKTTAASKVLENYIPPYDATVVKKLKTAGSIRQPASWCGIVGFKPTYGRVSRYGVISMASSLDSPGPMTKTVEGAALILQVLAGKDVMDSTTSLARVPVYSVQNKNTIKNLKIGVPKEYFFEGMDKEVIELVKNAISLFRKEGAEIQEINLLHPKYSVAVYTILQRSEVSSNLARYDGIRFGKGRNFFGEEAKRRIMLGTYALSSGYYDQYYLRAQKVRTLICKDFIQAFKKVDILIAPTTPTPALKIGASAEDPMFGEMQDILVEASTLAGLPGINLVCSFTKDNLPVGMQIIGPQFKEDLLIKVGHFFQQITNFHKNRPNF